MGKVYQTRTGKPVAVSIGHSKSRDSGLMLGAIKTRESARVTPDRGTRNLVRRVRVNDDGVTVADKPSVTLIADVFYGKEMADRVKANLKQLGKIERAGKSLGASDSQYRTETSETSIRTEKGVIVDPETCKPKPVRELTTKDTRVACAAKGSGDTKARLSTKSGDPLETGPKPLGFDSKKVPPSRKMLVDSIKFNLSIIDNQLKNKTCPVHTLIQYDQIIKDYDVSNSALDNGQKYPIPKLREILERLLEARGCTLEQFSL